MKQMTLHIPERYLIEIDEVVAQGYEPNRAEFIRLAVRDYLMRIDESVWSSLLPKGRQRSKVITLEPSCQIRDEVDMLVESGYETNISRLIRTAVRFYSAERYKRTIKPGKCKFSVMFPVRTVDMLDELIKGGCYESRREVIMSALSAYLEDIKPYTEKAYLCGMRPLVFNMLLTHIKKLDSLVRRGYVLNRNEAIREAINDCLLERKGIKLIKPNLKQIKQISLNERITKLLEDGPCSITEIYRRLRIYKLDPKMRRKQRNQAEKTVQFLFKKGKIDFYQGKFHLTRNEDN